MLQLPPPESAHIIELSRQQLEQIRCEDQYYLGECPLPEWVGQDTNSGGAESTNLQSPDWLPEGVNLMPVAEYLRQGSPTITILGWAEGLEGYMVAGGYVIKDELNGNYYLTMIGHVLDHILDNEMDFALVKLENIDGEVQAMIISSGVISQDMFHPEVNISSPSEDGSSRACHMPNLQESPPNFVDPIVKAQISDQELEVLRNAGTSTLVLDRNIRERIEENIPQDQDVVLRLIYPFDQQNYQILRTSGENGNVAHVIGAYDLEGTPILGPRDTRPEEIPSGLICTGDSGGPTIWALEIDGVLYIPTDDEGHAFVQGSISQTFGFETLPDGTQCSTQVVIRDWEPLCDFDVDD